MRYYSGLIAREYMLCAPGILGRKLINSLCPCDVKLGIRIQDPALQTRKCFADAVGGALDVIAHFDPVRLRRVQNEIHTVVHALGVLGSSYERAMKVSAVNLKCFFYPGDPDMTVKFLASVLVRDATYGYFFTRGILRRRRNHNRFDLLCCKEAERFLRRTGLVHTPWDLDHLSSLKWPEMLRIGLKDVVRGVNGNQ